MLKQIFEHYLRIFVEIKVLQIKYMCLNKLTNNYTIINVTSSFHDNETFS